MNTDADISKFNTIKLIPTTTAHGVVTYVGVDDKYVILTEYDANLHPPETIETKEWDLIYVQEKETDKRIMYVNNYKQDGVSKEKKDE